MITTKCELQCDVCECSPVVFDGGSLEGWRAVWMTDQLENSLPVGPAYHLHLCPKHASPLVAAAKRIEERAELARHREQLCTVAGCDLAHAHWHGT